MRNIPWAGLAALIAMFVIPFVPAWLFEGPRKVKHYPSRHVCGDCGAPWVAGHVCAVAETGAPGAAPLEVPGPALQGELRRLDSPAELERVSGTRITP